MTAKRILALPVTALFFAAALLFFGPYIALFVTCKTLSWLVGVGLGWNETWSEHVWN